MRTPHLLRKSIIFLVTLALSTWVFILIFGERNGLIITVSLLLHEMGHFVMFRRYGYTAGMFFVPLVGAACSPDNKSWLKKMSYRQIFAVAVAGPIVNAALCIIGLALALGDSTHGFGMTMAGLNAILCAFNLLPFKLLDGGKMASALYNSANEEMDQTITRVFTLGVTAAFFAIIFAKSGWQAFYLFPLFIFGFHRADDLDDPNEWKSKRAMSTSLINRWTTVYLSIMVFSLALFGYVPNWNHY